MLDRPSTHSPESVSTNAALGILSKSFRELRLTGFDHGSEVEIALAVAATARKALRTFVGAEGAFWHFDHTHWIKLEHDSLRGLLHCLDGSGVGVSSHNAKPLKLGSRMIDGVLRELACATAEPGFFDKPTRGIPVQNGLIQVDVGGRVTVVPHSPDHRRRFVIAAAFDPLISPTDLPSDSLLARLLGGAFQGDADFSEKIKLIEEALGAAAAGLATNLPQPKALVFYGPSARNGKSTVAALIESLLPPGAVSHISPAHFADERRLVHLAAKALNVCDELGGAAIAGEQLKAAVTGDSMSGRDLYRSTVEFRPEALHVFTTNVLPPFKGGLDRGLQRRLIVLQFNRQIPEREIIPNIAARVAHDELGLLVAMAVKGVQRLARCRVYTLPRSARDALGKWINSDPFSAWADERLQLTNERPPSGWPATKHLYDDFRQWARDEGYRDGSILVHGKFSEKLGELDGVEVVRLARGREARFLRLI